MDAAIRRQVEARLREGSNRGSALCSSLRQPAPVRPAFSRGVPRKDDISFEAEEERAQKLAAAAHGRRSTPQAAEPSRTRGAPPRGESGPTSRAGAHADRLQGGAPPPIRSLDGGSRFPEHPIRRKPSAAEDGTLEVGRSASLIPGTVGRSASQGSGSPLLGLSTAAPLHPRPPPPPRPTVTAASGAIALGVSTAAQRPEKHVADRPDEPSEAEHLINSLPLGRAPSFQGSVSPTRMVRAKEWNENVEDAYRLQEAGYRDVHEALSLGHPPIERWPGGFIKKLLTKESLAKSQAGGAVSMLYFRKARECEGKDVNKIKLYEYA
ncbi:hypothetical protein AB1Y20_015501 [Prymnesium parvum]|uniref:Uncharacterized protein n=1 Tax=Prymnesium parvum TaxID=97485 RepID=A0AB34K0X6_PRYPA